MGRPTNNQLSTSSYDVAGNTIYDTYNTYYYYPEGDLCAVQPNLTGSSLTMYVYDAAGTRVAKGTPVWTGSGSPNMSTLCSAPGGGTGWSFSAEEQYLLDKNNQQITELSGTGSPERSNFWAGTNIATYDFLYAPGSIHIALTDWLGSKRVQVASNGSNYGNPELNCISMPFGNNSGNTVLSDCRPVDSGGYDETEHHFTGKERDTESGNDYFGARYYASSMGRMLSPDQPFVDQDPSDPQSWNLNSYVRNNPLLYTDPNGKDCVKDNGDGTVTPNTGDCANENEDAANHEYYIDCDGCTTNAAGATLDTPTGNLYLTDANGNAISGTTVQGFADPQGVSTNVTVNGFGDWSVSVSGYGVGLLEYSPMAAYPYQFPDGEMHARMSSKDRFWAKVYCWMCGDPDNMKSSGARPNPPQDPGQSTDETTGQRNMNGPNKKGKDVPYNPNGNSSNEPDAAAGTAGYFATVGQCLSNVAEQ